MIMNQKLMKQKLMMLHLAKQYLKLIRKKEVKFGIILLRMRIIRKLKKLNAIIVEFLTLALMEVRLI